MWNGLMHKNWQKLTKMSIELQIDECGAEQTQENWKSMISLCNIDEQPSLKFSKEAVVLD